MLEVNRGSSITEMRQAYRRMSLKYHPDKKVDAISELYTVQTAYDVSFFILSQCIESKNLLIYFDQFLLSHP